MPAGGMRGAEPFGRSGRWRVMDVFAGLPFQPIKAFGGTVKDVTIGDVKFRIHTFTTVGSSSFVVTDLGDSDGSVEFLVVAGGGAGGVAGGRGGGGGAGGLLTNVDGAPFAVSVGSVSVAVGAGGLSPTTIDTAGGNGEPSTFSTFTATGGGGGGSQVGGQQARTGGSGGGGAANTNTSGAAGTSGQGNAGGNGTSVSNRFGGGGGGGRAAAGGTYDGGNGRAGAGGAGTIVNIVPASAATAGQVVNGNVVFAGGGGGGAARQGGGGLGGIGGGGLGQFSDANDVFINAAEAGQPNTGGGAGGQPAINTPTPGGSGVVIIRYPLQAVA